MMTAAGFLNQVRELVEPLTGDAIIAELIGHALTDHNEEMLDIAVSKEGPAERRRAVLASRLKLVERLEDLAERWMNTPK